VRHRSGVRDLGARRARRELGYAEDLARESRARDVGTVSLCAPSDLHSYGHDVHRYCARGAVCRDSRCARDRLQRVQCAARGAGHSAPVSRRLRGISDAVEVLRAVPALKENPMRLRRRLTATAWLLATLISCGGCSTFTVID